MKRKTIYLLVLVLLCLIPIEATTFKPPTQSTGSVSNKKPRAKRKHASSASAKRQCWQCGESKGLDAFDENSDICWSCYTENLKAEQENERLEAERQRQAEQERQRQEQERKLREAEFQHQMALIHNQETAIVNWENARNEYRSKTYTVGKVSFKMIAVSGGSFAMGRTEYDAQLVKLRDYWIGETEVTEGLWKAVMGKNPSKKIKGDNYPVENVTLDDCQKFISKLNQLTGETFQLPTEAQWEFAARGGNRSKGYKYSGSNNLDDAAWCLKNSGQKQQGSDNTQWRSSTYDDIYINVDAETGKAVKKNKCAKHIVATRCSNELRLYDMSGNVWEWCIDWHGASFIQSITPIYKKSEIGQQFVARGGSWTSADSQCSVDSRTNPTGADYSVGLRLVINGWDEPLTSLSVYKIDERVRAAQGRVCSFSVNGASFSMVAVKGGGFWMGATSEQEISYKDEKPAHLVTLGDYWLGQTEVTEELWYAVMGSYPSARRGNNHPVGGVSWDDCQAFIRKLNSLTGKTFRLPTEAEWEYAARGGAISKGYKYAGGNLLSVLAWYWRNSGDKLLYGDLDSGKVENNKCTAHPVATMFPNELGLYDMNGNVQEWCGDWYGDYSSKALTNPKGPSTGAKRVLRGGDYWNSEFCCRVCYREAALSSDKYYNYGLRLVLAADQPFTFSASR